MKKSAPIDLALAIAACLASAAAQGGTRCDVLPETLGPAKPRQECLQKLQISIDTATPDKFFMPTVGNTADLRSGRERYWLLTFMGKDVDSATTVSAVLRPGVFITDIPVRAELRDDFTDACRAPNCQHVALYPRDNFQSGVVTVSLGVPSPARGATYPLSLVAGQRVIGANTGCPRANSNPLEASFYTPSGEFVVHEKYAGAGMRVDALAIHNPPIPTKDGLGHFNVCGRAPGASRFFIVSLDGRNEHKVVSWIGKSTDKLADLGTVASGVMLKPGRWAIQPANSTDTKGDFPMGYQFQLRWKE
jgi:hypothetical protein